MIRGIKNPLIEKSKFLITPEPFENEIFSSWFARCAYAHHTYPKTFWHLHFPLKKFTYNLTPNIDASILEDVLEVLSEKTSFPVKKLRNMTMPSYDGYLQEEIIRNGSNKFLTQYRFCPKCWEEEKIPYLKKEHRIVFYTFCKKHKCYLHDKCPKCNTPINPYKMYNNELKYNFCTKCGFELCKTDVQYIEKNILYESNTQLLEVLEKGYINLGEFIIYSFSFFDILAHVSKLILLHKKIIIKNSENIFLKNFNSNTFSKTNNSFSRISIYEQYLLFGIIMNLFESFPKELKKYMLHNKLSYFDMLQDIKEVPYWYETTINDISPKIIYCARMITDKEIVNAISYLEKRKLIVNQANLTNLLNCNFFSSYNHLKHFLKKLQQ